MFVHVSQLLSQGRDDDHPIAIGKDGGLHSFKELRDDVSLNASKLQAKGASEVVLVADDSYRFVVGFLAILHAGCRVVLPANAQPGSLAKHIEDGAIVLADDCVGPGTPALKILSGVGCFDIQPLPRTDFSVNFYTSGSTGTPQKIVKTLASLEKEAEVLDRYWGDEVAGSRVLTTVSHQHMYGLTFKIFWPLSSGRPFVAETFSYWENLIPYLQAPCCIISSPAHLNRYPIFDKITRDQQPQMIVSAGAPLSFDAANKTEQILGTLPTEIFGSTETGIIAHRHQREENAPWTMFDVAQGAEGEGGALRVRSYFLDTGEWYQMNDLVEFFEDGRFLLKGRADRVVKIEGKRVSLPEIEGFLISHDWVEEAAVFVLDDDRQSLAAVVSLAKEGQKIRENAGDFRFSRRLREEMRSHFDQMALPRRWRFVDQVPVNRQGKRLKHELRALFE